MKRKILLVTALCAVAACDRNTEPRATSEITTTTESAAAGPSATNTGKNERDRDPGKLTPEDQGGSETDRGLTQRVRQGVVGADALSMTGKNVKIITQAGVVTLRGPVKTAAEKAQIGAIAAKTDGVKRVDNQLEIAN
jgi:hyperosmotically inducible periplasmic protein